MSWFRKTHECPCGNTWTEEWSCLCDDECSRCGKDIEVSEDEDLSIVVEEIQMVQFEGADPNAPAPPVWRVMISPATAEDDPDYRMVAEFANRIEADELAKQLPYIGQDERACTEGWALFTRSDNGELELQADHESPIFCRQGAAYDDEALAYVKAQADAGSIYHKAALARVGTLDW
jgi:hypothetical protein